MTANIEHWLKAEPVQNFGDFLSQFLVQELFYPVGMPARHGRRLSRAGVATPANIGPLGR